jgi:hypothetical protein
MGRKPGAVRPWAREELAALRAWAGRVPSAEIARRLGRTESAVRSQARSWGWPLRVLRP